MDTPSYPVRTSESIASEFSNGFSRVLMSGIDAFCEFSLMVENVSDRAEV